MSENKFEDSEIFPEENLILRPAILPVAGSRENWFNQFFGPQEIVFNQCSLTWLFMVTRSDSN